MIATRREHTAAKLEFIEDYYVTLDIVCGVAWSREIFLGDCSRVGKLEGKVRRKPHMTISAVTF
jgi:hypothetical protein